MILWPGIPYSVCGYARTKSWLPPVYDICPVAVVAQIAYDFQHRLRPSPDKAYGIGDVWRLHPFVDDLLKVIGRHSRVIGHDDGFDVFQPELLHRRLVLCEYGLERRCRFPFRMS